MRAIVDSIHGTAVHCLVENGDMLHIHKSFLPKNIEPGCILKISFEIDKEAMEQQKEIGNQ